MALAALRKAVAASTAADEVSSEELLDLSRQSVAASASAVPEISVVDGGDGNQAVPEAPMKPGSASLDQPGVASSSANVEPASAMQADSEAATATFSAVSMIDKELEAVAVVRDITSEPVAPKTKTEEEVEAAAKAAAKALGSDPVLPSDQAATVPGSQGAAAEETAAPASSTEPAGIRPEDTPFELDAKTAAELGIPGDIAKMIAGLAPAQARQFVEGLHAAPSAAAERESEPRDKHRKPSHGGGGFSLFGGLASALGTHPPEKSKRKTDPASMLSKENIIARVEEMRRTEILDHASRLTRSHAAMATASKAFNDALLATDAGKSFDAKVNELAAAHPELDRQRILGMSMNGTLASAIGSDPLKPLVVEAFKSDAVKGAWGQMEKHADSVESNSKQMLERMKAFEEHFPKSVDTDRLNKVVENAMEGIEKGFDEAMAQSPEAKRAWKERLEALAKQVKVFIERMLSKLGLGSYP